MDIAVIGGGVFGVMSAIRLAESGCSVTLFERLPELMSGTTHIGDRLHFGYHYPRDEVTAQQSARGFTQFKSAFSAAVIPGVTNDYFISSENSLTSAQGYVEFCDRLHLPYRTIDLSRYRPRVANVDLGIGTDELMFDPSILRALMTKRLQDAGAGVRLETQIIGITRRGPAAFEVETDQGSRERFQAVVNCSYSDLNRLTDQLGYDVDSCRHEYVAVPVVKLDLPRTVSITVMDGPFMCLLPLGHDGTYLLFDLVNCALSEVNTLQLDAGWVSENREALAQRNQAELFDTIRERCGFFVPKTREAELVGFWQGIRTVLTSSTPTSARRSEVTLHEDGYLTVFSGKIDHCLWVAQEVLDKVNALET
ncbi:MAG: FAD-dependent oxidoreductase [Pseudomonadota bacterium]